MTKKLLACFLLVSMLSGASAPFELNLREFADKNPDIVADLVGFVVAAGFTIFLFHKGRIAPGDYQLKAPRWFTPPDYGPLNAIATFPAVARAPSPEAVKQETTASLSPQMHALLSAIVSKAKEPKGLNSDAQRFGQ